MITPRLKSPEFAVTMSQGFYETGRSLARQSHKDEKTGYIWIPPAVVNFSFATELLLKGLLMIDSNVSIKGHKLLDLYKKVKVPTRKQVEELYHMKDSRPTLDLPSYRVEISRQDEEVEGGKENIGSSIEDLLKIHSESFENWRYLYEFGEEGSRNEFDFKAMDNFYNCLREVLLERLKNRPPRFGMKKV